MFKLIPLFLFSAIFTCQRPAPQQPKVVYSGSYVEKVKQDSVLPIRIPDLDSIKKDTLQGVILGQP